MSEKVYYLSWQPGRRRPWTEHNCFPRGAIKWRDESRWDYNNPMHIFRLEEGRTKVTYIPPRQWDEEERRSKGNV